MKKWIPFLFILFTCRKSPSQSEPVFTYEDTPQAFTITGASIKEASGIADSKSIPGHLWIQEDGGNASNLYILKHDGTVVDSVQMEGIVNRDWEEIVLGKGPDAQLNYLYLGETGDNNLVYAEYSIYRFVEPVAGVKKVADFDVIRIAYTDGSHDVEAFIVDDATKDIYLITKRDQPSRVYKIAYPQSTTDVNEAVFVSDLPYTGVVAATLSPDGKQMIIKTYTTLNYYVRQSSQQITDLFRMTPKTLAYKLEPQGEAVCFAIDGSGFFTLSEEAMGVIPELNFYKRKN